MTLREEFLARYGSEPAIFWAPGRVNLIGEHIDYCGGCVLPMPIQFGTEVAIAIGGTPRVRAASLDVADPVEFEADVSPSLPRGHWGRFVVGAMTGMAGLIDGRGVDILVSGDIPGSGLSSSASLSVALLAGLGATLGARMTPLQLAKAAQRIEHEFVGVECGLMDQAVIAMGVADAALLFDCRSEVARPVALPADGPEVLVIDSGKRRALAHSAYNERLEETGRAARVFGIGRAALAGVSLDRAILQELDPVAARRLRHVVSEQHRVETFVSALGARDWSTLGRLFRDSHVSLAEDFEVSCTELDSLVDLLNAHPDCLGARMTGAGFGGSVVALIERGRTALVRDAVGRDYAPPDGAPLKSFVARSTGGVRQTHG